MGHGSHDSDAPKVWTHIFTGIGLWFHALKPLRRSFLFKAFFGVILQVMR